MTSSKSSKTAYNLCIGILVIWSIISLITIVVLATSPDMKKANKCQSDLQAQAEKFKDVRVVWEKDRKALEEHLEVSWENQTRLIKEVGMMIESQQKINESLKTHMEENVILRENITMLENEIEAQREFVKNLTLEIRVHKEQLEDLHLNLTEAFHLLKSCESSHEAAVMNQKAAQSRVKACESTTLSLRNQLHRCKSDGSSRISHSTIPECERDNGSPALFTSTLVFSVLSFVSLHLMFFL